MKRIKNLEFWLVVIVLVFFAASVTNASALAGKYQKVASSLSSQIKKDFSDDNVSIEIIRAENIQISQEEENLFGDAYIVSRSQDTKTHIYFEAIMETKTNNVSMVDYTFVENKDDINVNFLQRLLIKKIGDDHKTKEVVFSLNDIEKVAENQTAEIIRGEGEARIGGFGWKKVKFEITQSFISSSSQDFQYQNHLRNQKS